jgi:hypothetical protein
MQLEKIARLVDGDSDRLGGVPGEFPFYFDPERRLIMKEGSDPVAAARFIETVLIGELGLTIRPAETSLNPPKNSQIRWLSMHDLRLRTKGSVFVGRANDTVFLATSFSQPVSEGAFVFSECERLTAGPHSEVLLFNSPYQLLCVGNNSSVPQSVVVNVPLRDRTLAKSLSAEQEELDQDTGRWKNNGRIRLTEKLPVRVELRPLGWKFLKFSQISS